MSITIGKVSSRRFDRIREVERLKPLEKVTRQSCCNSRTTNYNLVQYSQQKGSLDRNPGALNEG